MNLFKEKINIALNRFVQIGQALHTKLNQVGNLYSHSDLFGEDVNLLKVCFGLCLRILVAYFSWSQWFMNERLMVKLKGKPKFCFIVIYINYFK